jgi:hypothetical protein
MSNEAKAVCTSQLAAFFAQGHRAVLPQPRCLALLIRACTYSLSSRKQITQTLLFIKKRLPTNVGQTAHDHSVLCYGLFVRITPTRLCLNTFGVSCRQKF